MHFGVHMTVGEVISVVSLILTALGTFGGWFWQRQQERVSVRTAIVAEVRALYEVAKERKYFEALSESAEQLAEIPEGGRPVHQIMVQIADTYCRVYNANLTKLGYLEPVDALSVVRFYQFIDSVIRDVTKGGHLFEGSSDPVAFLDAANILEKAFAEAETLAKRHSSTVIVQ